MELLLSFFLGIFGSIIAAYLVGPVVTIAAGYHFIRALTWLRKKIIHDEMFDIPWTQQWDVLADEMPKSFPSKLTLYRFTHLLAGEFRDADETGMGVYRVVAVIDGNRITGTWKDIKPMGYYGTFQLLISHKRDEASGKWIGFSTRASIVRAGSWIWTPNYSST
jgi:hypothetical protein